MINMVRAAATRALERSSNALEMRDHRYHLLASEAYLQLARGDTSAALQRFDQLPGDLCLLCYYDRLIHARLLLARGRTQQAATVLRERLAVMQSPVEVLFALERGRAAERLGRQEEAAAAYRWVASAWRHADPVLRPLVAEARRGILRLSHVRPPVS
jgi:hypothetical protein